MFKRTLCVTLLFLSIWLPKSSSAALVINEVMANNVAAVGNQGNYPDWVELHNTGVTTINLSGVTLTDNLNLPGKFGFPADAQLGPGGYVVVWCDSAFVPGEFHAGFSFNANGEEVGLFDAGGNLLDSVKFGLQTPDLSIGRIPNGSGAWALTVPSPSDANTAQPLGDPTKLRINEWMASTSSGSDWLELYNSANFPVALGGCVFSDKTSTPAANPAIPALSFIGAEAFFQFAATGETNNAQVSFKLGAGGETITLFAPNRSTVLNRVKFGAQTTDVSEGKLPDGTDTIVAFPIGKSTPGASNFQPIENVVINEVLTHTDFPLEDAVELFNPTPLPVVIGGWWLSNSRSDAKKFRIPNGTTLAPGGFWVCYEYQFDPDDTGNGRNFRFDSAEGDECHLYSADAAGNLLGGRASVDLPPGENAVSFGRYQTSQGSQFVPLATRTFGQDNPPNIVVFRSGTGKTNSGPKIGPLVITEIMYHPTGVEPPVDDLAGEYVEVRNVSGAPLQLYNALNDLNAPTNSYRLEGQVRFQFPIKTVLAANAYALIVGFPPTNSSQAAAFRARYGISTNVLLFGPYRGRLSNGGGAVELQKPDEVQRPPHPNAGLIPFLYVDKVKYNDVDPWPVEADGQGNSLHRKRLDAFANDPANWYAGTPSPGSGAPPPVPISISSINVNGNTVSLTFMALAGYSFRIDYLDSLAGATWKALPETIPVQATDTTWTVRDTRSSTINARYYRLVSPAQ